MMIFNLLSHTPHSEKGERARIHVKHTISFATLSCTFAWHFFWYFVWLLKMLRVVKIVRNKKKIGKFSHGIYVCVILWKRDKFHTIFSLKQCTFRSNSVCHVCLKCRSIYIIIILWHQNLKDMYTMWQKLIQSEQMCVVIFYRIALASREKKSFEFESSVICWFQWILNGILEIPIFQWKIYQGVNETILSGYKWSNIPATNEWSRVFEL